MSEEINDPEEQARYWWDQAAGKDVIIRDLRADLTQVTKERDDWRAGSQVEADEADRLRKEIKAERARAKGLFDLVADFREGIDRNGSVAWSREEAKAWYVAAGNILSPSPAKEAEKCGRDSDGYCGLHDSHDCPPAVEKPCRPDNPCGSRDCPSDAPAVEKPCGHKTNLAACAACDRRPGELR